jgi:hypothetical protein
MPNNSVKLLATGPVSGLFSEFFDKLRSIDAKHGKFDFVLCVGDFFGAAKDEEIRRLLDGELERPHCHSPRYSSIRDRSSAFCENRW